MARLLLEFDWRRKFLTAPLSLSLSLFSMHAQRSTTLFATRTLNDREKLSPESIRVEEIRSRGSERLTIDLLYLRTFSRRLNPFNGIRL